MLFCIIQCAYYEIEMPGALNDKIFYAKKYKDEIKHH